LDSDYGPHFLEVADPSKHKILPSLLVFHVLRCPLWPLAFVISSPVMRHALRCLLPPAAHKEQKHAFYCFFLLLDNRRFLCLLLFFIVFYIGP